MQEILGCVKQYHWGKPFEKSFIGKLVKSSGNDEKISYDQEKPVAEYWLGTHSSGKLVFANGDRVPEELKLPFLLKVLSVNQCLSIQLHPDIEDAQHLHQSDPTNYPDSSAKPELVVALTTFRALCGFRPAHDINKDVHKSKTLLRLCGESDGSIKIDFHNRMAIVNALTNILRMESSLVKLRIDSCLEEMDDASNDVCKLIEELRLTYPCDPGLFLCFFLQLHSLQVGESLYVPPGVPHAYLAGGDAIELMLCSDNVIRCGLTPKFIDLDNALRLMQIEEIQKLCPSPLAPCFSIYEIPYFKTYMHLKSLRIDENSVCPIKIPASLKERNGIILVVSGSCKVSCNVTEMIIKEGQSFLVMASIAITIEQVLTLPLELFHAF